MNPATALGHFLLRTAGTGLAVTGGFLVTNELPMTLQVIGGLTLIGIGAAIFVASMVPNAKTNTTNQGGQ